MLNFLSFTNGTSPYIIGVIYYGFREQISELVHQKFLFSMEQTPFGTVAAEWITRRIERITEPAEQITIRTVADKIKIFIKICRNSSFM
ncbi:hypothetical protein CEXT_284101 [Caerostris extrusa]|uniref:Uncharacterized protein n=1 Tax=Caerostris extrusa TaxID=172846 RepID=A0AAV4N7Z7_CAEEX|nr:hypothetical protein CEXT_284101 [Caerostris extrusa]